MVISALGSKISSFLCNLLHKAFCALKQMPRGLCRCLRRLGWRKPDACRETDILMLSLEAVSLLFWEALGSVSLRDTGWVVSSHTGCLQCQEQVKQVLHQGLLSCMPFTSQKSHVLANRANLPSKKQ